VQEPRLAGDAPGLELLLVRPVDRAGQAHDPVAVEGGLAAEHGFEPAVEGLEFLNELGRAVDGAGLGQHVEGLDAAAAVDDEARRALADGELARQREQPLPLVGQRQAVPRVDVGVRGGQVREVGFRRLLVHLGVGEIDAEIDVSIDVHLLDPGQQRAALLGPAEDFAARRPVRLDRDQRHMGEAAGAPQVQEAFGLGEVRLRLGHPPRALPARAHVDLDLQARRQDRAVRNVDPVVARHERRAHQARSLRLASIWASLGWRAAATSYSARAAASLLSGGGSSAGQSRDALSRTPGSI
jgi:hypothetical protein